MQGAYKNDLIGLEFDPLVPGDPKLKGEDVIKNMFGIPLDHSKWWNLFVVLVIFLSYRLTFFIVLKFKERVVPHLTDLFAILFIQYVVDLFAMLVIQYVVTYT